MAQHVIVAVALAAAIGASSGAHAQAGLAPRDEDLLISIDVEGTVYVAEYAVSEAELERAAATFAIRAGFEGSRAVIRADRRLPFARVAHVMTLLRRAGIGRLAFHVASERPEND